MIPKACSNLDERWAIHRQNLGVRGTQSDTRGRGDRCGSQRGVVEGGAVPQCVQMLRQLIDTPGR